MKFTGCVSLNGRFSFLLPPGKYEIQAYSEGPNGVVSPEEVDSSAVLGDIGFEVTGSTDHQDLGTINLVDKTTSRTTTNTDVEDCSK